MSTSLGSYVLLNRITQEFDPAELFSPIGPDHIRDFRNLWQPAFKHRLARMALGETYASAQVQDQDWKWPEKSEITRDRLDYESFAVVASGLTQGLMIVSLAKTGRIESQRGQHLVYVELLATAPWNRPGFSATSAQYKGVGRLLLAAAISLSAEQEFSSRIGLHAIAQSASWYRDMCGMTELGHDDAHQGLIYFEMTPEQAAAFVS